jgi:DNA invertase Pin-like site-specific DNA recombinase
MEVTVSSRKPAKERKIDMLLEELIEGDTLIVSELSRMGRSVGEIITIVDTLVKKQISFFAVKEGIRLYGSQDCEEIQTKVMVTLFGLFAEIERKLISMRRALKIMPRKHLLKLKLMAKNSEDPKGY